MDPQKDIDIRGNRIVNLANPARHDHAATKSYVDYVHILRPDDNAEEYVRYINARNATLHSIAGLCKIECTFDWAVDPTRVKHRYIGPYVLLESTTGHCLYAIRPQDLTGKNITVEYLFPVEVHKWDIHVLYEGEYDHDDFIYLWQASNDKETWVQITQPANVTVRMEDWNGCDGILSFTNTHSIGRYRYWRVRIQHGKVTKAPYFNIMLMTVG